MMINNQRDTSFDLINLPLKAASTLFDIDSLIHCHVQLLVGRNRKLAAFFTPCFYAFSNLL
jgi:hypothetical protein